MWLELYQLVLVLIVATLIAVTLDPVVSWVQRRGLSRALAATTVSLLLVVVVGGFLWLTWESLNNQAMYVTHHFSEVEQLVMSKLPPWARDMMATRGQDLTSYAAPYFLRFARSTAAALVVSLLGFIITVYLLIEGRRTRDWLLAFVPTSQRRKAEQTLDECHTVIFGYVAGNVATSAFATLFVFVALSILKVPAALLLALLAGLCDFIPVMGFLLSALPGVAMAATVSPTVALVAAALYVAYHGIENYFIAPYVYGDRLKLSNVAVILAFAVGAELAGVIGALIALPIAAIYPAIERIWLREKVGDQTVREHRAIERRSA
jgi:predicted PurR-regulated permease PerM